MRFVAVVFLIAGMLCNAALASAEGPIPFSALEQSANAQASAALSHEATGNSTPASPRPMTSGGKVMTGVGIGLLGLGVALIAVGAATNKNEIAGSSIREVGFAAGGGSLAIGTSLIIIGLHRRSSK
jgi:hypothetical protein